MLLRKLHVNSIFENFVFAIRYCLSSLSNSGQPQEYFVSCGKLTLRVEM